MSNARAWRPTDAILLAAALILGSCSSPARNPSASLSDVEPGEISEASKELTQGCLSAVELRGSPLVTIQETVESVFTDAGLAMAHRSADEIVFERTASRSERMAYGTWYGSEVRVRLRVGFLTQGRDAYLLRCRCFLARDAGGYGEDEQQLARRRVREYEDLLNEVWRRLN